MVERKKPEIGPYTNKVLRILGSYDQNSPIYYGGIARAIHREETTKEHYNGVLIALKELRSIFPGRIGTVTKGPKQGFVYWFRPENNL